MNKCFWCEKETNNPPEEIINGYGEKILVVFCDKHKKAREEAVELLGNS